MAALVNDGDFFDLPIQAFPALIELCLSYAIGELKGDTQEAAKRERTYLKQMSSLARNARLIDVPTDVLSFIIARRTRTQVPRRLPGI